MIYCSTVLNILAFHNCCGKLWIKRKNICIFLSLLFAWYFSFIGLNLWKGKQMKKSESMIITWRNSKEWRRSKNALYVVNKSCCIIFWKIIFYSVWKKGFFLLPLFCCRQSSSISFKGQGERLLRVLWRQVLHKGQSLNY